MVSSLGQSRTLVVIGLAILAGCGRSGFESRADARRDGDDVMFEIDALPDASILPMAQRAYVKASNPGSDDRFGGSVALSADGSVMAVGGFFEASAATGINGNQADNSAGAAGAVYLFTRIAGTWSQQAYIKASNTRPGTNFGTTVALSGDGSSLAVGANNEESAAVGVNGNQADTSAPGSGAVYVFVRTGTTWSQQAYLKASNTNAGDSFGFAMAMSSDGSTIAVGAFGEDSAATGINGNQADNSAATAGAVYVFTRAGTSWSQQAYIKASNTGSNDEFGASVALSADGSTLAVGADSEASSAFGVGGDQANNSAIAAGAAYVFARAGTLWSQQAYVKASNTGATDTFGAAVALSGDGTTLAVGASGEKSASTGVNGNQADNSAPQAGAVYVYTRAGTTWMQEAYVKASTVHAADIFGCRVALSLDGSILGVGAFGEDSAATGIGGDQADTSASFAGAAYLFARGTTGWSQRLYLKASNTGANDWFGNQIAVAGDGATFAVGALQEDSAAAGIGGNQADDSLPNAGAAYVFE